MSLSRRRFLGSLAGLTAITALAGAGIRLPKREEFEVKVDPYLADLGLHRDFDTASLRYKSYERFSNRVEAPVDLTEKSFDNIIRQLLDSPLSASIRPTKWIMSPAMYREHRLASMPWFDRLIYRLTEGFA